MRDYNVKDDSKISNRHIVAKPLAENIKISPRNSMVMFNLNGTLMRNGVLLRKILSRTCQLSVDKGFDIHTEVERTPIADYLNRMSIDISQKLEEHIKSNKFPPDVHSLFLPNHIVPIIENSLNPDDADKFLSEDVTKDISLKIAQNIHDMLIKDTEMKALLEKSFDIYDKQTTVGSQKIIMPEVTNMIENMANLGVPVAIVSNKTQEFVTKAFNRIFETLSPQSQKKWHNKEWHFAKIGVQRDDDGDLIQPIKPAPDLLISSHTKAEKFNLKNNRDPIKNVIFIGNSETFDMRAADNLQRSHYALDNGINTYKLLCRYDDPTKKINDTTLIDSKSVLKHIDTVNQRLTSVFDDSKK